jgi:hypothetical protein
MWVRKNPGHNREIQIHQIASASEELKSLVWKPEFEKLKFDPYKGIVANSLLILEEHPDGNNLGRHHHLGEESDSTAAL